MNDGNHHKSLPFVYFQNTYLREHNVGSHQVKINRCRPRTNGRIIQYELKQPMPRTPLLVLESQIYPKYGYKNFA